MLAKSLPRMTHRCLDPAPLSTSSCNCGRILCGNQRIAFVPAAGTLPGLFADFEQFLRGLLDAPATLRGHLAPEKVRMAATGAIPFAGRCGSEKAALIVRPLPFAVLGEASTAGGKFNDRWRLLGLGTSANFGSPRGSVKSLKKLNHAALSRQRSGQTRLLTGPTDCRTTRMSKFLLMLFQHVSAKSVPHCKWLKVSW